MRRRRQQRQLTVMTSALEMEEGCYDYWTEALARSAHKVMHTNERFVDIVRLDQLCRTLTKISFVLIPYLLG